MKQEWTTNHSSRLHIEEDKRQVKSFHQNLMNNISQKTQNPEAKPLEVQNQLERQGLSDMVSNLIKQPGSAVQRRKGKLVAGSQRSGRKLSISINNQTKKSSLSIKADNHSFNQNEHNFSKTAYYPNQTYLSPSQLNQTCGSVESQGNLNGRFNFRNGKSEQVTHFDEMKTKFRGVSNTILKKLRIAEDSGSQDKSSSALKRAISQRLSTNKKVGVERFGASNMTPQVEGERKMVEKKARMSGNRYSSYKSTGNGSVHSMNPKIAHNEENNPPVKGFAIALQQNNFEKVLKNSFKIPKDIPKGKSISPQKSGRKAPKTLHINLASEATQADQSSKYHSLTNTSKTEKFLFSQTLTNLNGNF